MVLGICSVFSQLLSAIPVVEKRFRLQSFGGFIAQTLDTIQSARELSRDDRTVDSFTLSLPVCLAFASDFHLILKVFIL